MAETNGKNNADSERVIDKRQEEMLLQDASPEIHSVINKYQSRIKQLSSEIKSRKEENDKIANENLLQNEKLRELNTKLDKKVKDRTFALETSKKELEGRNQELQELSESKEAMMHMIVHDMKNPLTAVMGALALVQKVKCEGMSQDFKELLTDAHIQSIKLRTMMDDILTMSKMKSREFQADQVEVDLISLMQQSILLMNTIKGDKILTLVFDPPCSELNVFIDFMMIERVINNIINNAIKYAPEGSQLVLNVNIEKKEAIVSISDFGIGIPKDFHNKIFDLFTRVNPQDKKISGTGLGLAFCKLAIEAHNGRIWVESPVKDYDCGTTFKFSLPLAQSQEKQKITYEK